MEMPRADFMICRLGRTSYEVQKPIDQLINGNVKSGDIYLKKLL